MVQIDYSLLVQFKEFSYNLCIYVKEGDLSFKKNITYPTHSPFQWFCSCSHQVLGYSFALFSTHFAHCVVNVSIISNGLQLYALQTRESAKFDSLCCNTYVFGTCRMNGGQGRDITKKGDKGLEPSITMSSFSLSIIEIKGVQMPDNFSQYENLCSFTYIFFFGLCECRFGHRCSRMAYKYNRLAMISHYSRGE